MTCLRSGYCCKKAPCPFGQPISIDNLGCKFLGGDSPGKYYCQKYDEIQAGMPDNAADMSPAFGAGCSSPLNTDRLNLLSSSE